MKKFTTGLFLLLITVFAITLAPVKALAASKTLIISYDHRKNMGNIKKMSLDAVSSATVYSGPTGEKKSTEETIRDTIKEVKKAKVFEIKVKKPYSADYQNTVNRADKEIDQNKNIKLKISKIPKLKKYDKIYLVTPVWHGDLPQPVRVLLRKNNFRGKMIIVFGVNLGSGFGDIISSVRKECPGAKVVKAKTYYGDARNDTVRKKVKRWLKSKR